MAGHPFFYVLVTAAFNLSGQVFAVFAFVFKNSDFLVLNKNYFDEKAVPDLMIKTVRPLMTVIGGHIRYLLGGDGWTDTDDAITLLAQLFHCDQVGEILRLRALLCLRTATSACPTDVMSRRLR